MTLLDDHQLADGLDVMVRAHARFELNGNTDSIGRLQGQGTLSFNGRSLPVRSGRLTVNSGILSVFPGEIIGNGGLTQDSASSGGLDLSGTNTFSGTTILSGGLLQVEGVQTNSPIRLNGGKLAGQGRVGTITGNLGGTVQPGFDGAALQNSLHSRDVTFNSTTTFRPLLTLADPGFENSQLQVSGAVNLSGSALDIELQFVPSPGRSFEIIDNDGADAVVATFSGLPEGAIFNLPNTHLRWRITYAGGDGNDVVLTLAEIDYHPTMTSITVDSLSIPGWQTVRLSATCVARGRDGNQSAPAGLDAAHGGKAVISSVARSQLPELCPRTRLLCCR